MIDGTSHSFGFDPAQQAEAFTTAAELTGAIVAGAVAGGREVTHAQQAEMLNVVAPGIAYFAELARQAGELAGNGDPLGAISLLGGEENARLMIGDDEVEGLLKLATAQMMDEFSKPPEL